MPTASHLGNSKAVDQAMKSVFCVGSSSGSLLLFLANSGTNSCEAAAGKEECVKRCRLRLREQAMGPLGPLCCSNVSLSDSETLVIHSRASLEFLALITLTFRALGRNHMRQRLLRPPQCFVLIGQSDSSPCPLRVLGWLFAAQGTPKNPLSTRGIK